MVIFLVALPVAGILGGSGLARVVEPTPEERASRTLGAADLRVAGWSDWQERRSIEELFGPGAHRMLGAEGLERIGVPGRTLRARFVALPPEALAPEALVEGATPGSGLAVGMVSLREGRAPTNAGEVALSPSLLEGLGRQLGDTVTLEFGAPRTVTGVVVDPEDLTLPLVLRTPSRVELPRQSFLLVDLPDGSLETAHPQTAASREMVADLRGAGYVLWTRPELSVPDRAVTALVYALGILGLFEAGLIISATFAVGLRRRQVEIGLLGATGAAPGGIVVSLLLSAVLLALLGGVLGMLLGTGALLTLEPWLETWTQRQVSGAEVPVGHAVAAVLLGLLAAVLAAVLPAIRTARRPILQAMAGRRPPDRSTRGWLLAGTAMVVAGTLMLGLASEDGWRQGLGIVVGPILGLVGFGVCSPWLLDALARLGGRLPLAWRLAVRDAGRFRERNGAVVTAVLAGMAMSVTVATLVASLETAIAAFPMPLHDDQLLVEGAAAEATAALLESELSVLASAPWTAAYLGGEPLRGRLTGGDLGRRHGWVAVGGEALVRALGAEEGAEALDQGALLMLDPPEGLERATLNTWVAEVEVATPEVVGVSTPSPIREPAFVLGEAAVDALGLETGPPPNRSLVPWVVRLESPVTPEILERARTLAARVAGTEIDALLLHSSPFRAIYRAVVLLCGLTGLLVVVTATSLSAAESAAEGRILHAVGAAPRLMRRQLAARSGYLALLGCALALPAGLLAASGMLAAVTFPLDFVLPWGDALAIVLGLPALVYLGTWCLAPGGAVVGFPREARR